MVQLVDAVDQLAHNMADSLSRSLAESLIKDDDSKAVENDAPDIHEQTHTDGQCPQAGASTANDAYG